MYLYRLKINNFKRLKDVEVFFGKTTFIIGENNCGKSSTLQAIQALLSSEQKLGDEFFSYNLEEEEESKIILEAEFRNMPEESKEWRGFRGRILEYDNFVNTNETGLSCIYKKTYEKGKSVQIEIFSQQREIKDLYADLKTANDYISVGQISKEDFIKVEITNLDKNFTTKDKEKLELINEIWNISEDKKPVWVLNPGGISQNVLSKLPKFILIPAHSSSEVLADRKGALHETLNELFSEIKQTSEHFQKAQESLYLLSKELDPDDSASKFGIMMQNLNGVLSSVFPDTYLHVAANLSDADKVITPQFDVEMASNVKTKIEHQGTGMIRSAVFGMLRYREQQKLTQNRPLIIGFEEPELYLHPNAANQMRNSIYDLSSDSLQIISTTHSPYFIDLSKDGSHQVINSFTKAESDEIEATPFNILDSFKGIEEDKKSHLKMLLAIDDRIARMFFVKNTIIVEGNTEEVVLKESLKLLKDQDIYNRIISDFEIINARGKATIIGLVKYLVAMGIKPIVIHDKDEGNEGAEKFNRPIEDALAGKGRIIQMVNEMEDELGYKAPTNEKPYKAFQQIQKWKSWDDVPENWKEHLLDIFEGYLTNYDLLDRT